MGSESTRTEAIRYNSKLTCMCDRCDEPRWQLYKYCRRHSAFYRSYKHPDARAIKVHMYRDNYPRVRNIVDLNRTKQSFKLAEAFFENLANGRVLPANSEFASVPSMLRMSTKWDTREIIVRLGSLILLGEEEEPTFLTDRHRIHQVGAHFLKYLKVRKLNTNDLKQTRLYLEIGSAIWKGVGPFLLNLARTVIRAEKERKARISAQLEELDY